MITGPLETVDEPTLAALVTNGVSEGRRLEFKRDVPDSGEKSIKEFLADVTAFANAQGGDILFGISERGGAAAAIEGVSSADPDALLLSFENRLRDTVEPRLSGLQMHWVPLANGRGVLILRIPASLSAPHRVTFKNANRFYGRNSRGKYEMDTHELRAAFTEAEQWPARFESLHQAARLAAHGEERPFRIDANPMAVATVTPVGFFRERREIEITPETAVMPFHRSSHIDAQLTLEGVLIRTPLNEKPAPTTPYNAVQAYALTHRLGRVEAAWSIGGEYPVGRGALTPLVYPDRFELGLLDLSRATAARFHGLGIDGPWVLQVSLDLLKDHQLVFDDHHASNPAWRTAARLPDVMIEAVSEAALLPMFKAFWRTFGAERPADREAGD